jgi:putative tricarboxylic transport membrane protein
MKYTDLISGIFWLFFGILFSIWSMSYHIGNLTRPGPGFLPLVLGILVILFSLIILGRGWKICRAKEMGSSSFVPAGWKKIVYTTLILFVSPFAFEPLGYLLTIFLLIALLMLGRELKSLKKALLTALLAAVGVHVVFVWLLEQPFPRGLLRF